MNDSATGQSPLSVFMATTSYPRDAADWKGRFIYDLAAALDRTGQTRLRLWGPPGELPGRVISADSTRDAAWLEQMAQAGGIAHLLRRRPLAGLRYSRGLLARLRRSCRANPPDMYHVNWLQLVFGLPADRRPAYVGVLGSDFGLLDLPGMKPLLRRAFRRRPTMLAPNAQWMAAKLTEHFGDVATVRPNPFGVLPDWFAVPRSPANPPEWLVVTRITRNKLGDLLEWGDGLFGTGRKLRLLGPMQEQVALPEWIDYGGATNPEQLRARWFPRATGLLTLSRHDEGRPQVMIEAMASGLPVVASAIPAHGDLLCQGETGWLVDSRDQLAQALQATEAADAIGPRARQWLREHVGTWDDHARRCVAAYRHLLEGL